MLSTFAVKLKPGDNGDKKNTMGNQRLKGWWDSIPVIPVEVVQNPEEESGLKKE